MTPFIPKNNVKNGVEETYINGGVWRRTEYKNGVIDGDVTIYHLGNKEQISCIFQVENGKLNGESVHYDKNGRLLYICTFTNNVLQKMSMYNKSGQLTKIRVYQYTGENNLPEKSKKLKRSDTEPYENTDTPVLKRRREMKHLR